MAGIGKYKAIISDMGGVIVKYSSPTLIEDLFKQAEKNEDIDKIIADFELGHKDVKEIAKFVSLIENEELKKEISTLLQGLASSISSSDDAVVAAFKKLKGAGFKMALLTNIGWTDESKTKTMIHIDTTYFDVIVESCKIAMRKPYSDIYKYTLSQLGLQPEECIFIDDLKTNCVGAEQLGMKAIQVVRGDTETALKELESLTGVSLF
uniref:Uncharacterized protein n=1 Tax=Panagrolaimus sp. PS1159 TaxID=55785 RepID=A0AC35GK19_9BILA